MAAQARDTRSIRRVAAAAVLTASLVAPAALSAQTDDPGAGPAAAAPVEGDATLPANQEASAPPANQEASAPPAQAEPPPGVPLGSSANAGEVSVTRATASATKSVSIIDYDFKPKVFSVNLGDTVEWTNDGKVAEGHDVTGDGLDSGLMRSGDTYSHTFSDSGSFSYICTIHPSMKGTVRVLARAGGGGSGGSGASGSGTSAGQASVPATTPSSLGTATGQVSDGSGGSLPASGSDSLTLVIIGLALLDLGLALRVLRLRRAARRAL